MAGLDQMLDAIRFGPKLAFFKNVNVEFPGAGLKSANEMAGETDTTNRQLQTTSDEQINATQGDGISRPLIDHTVYVAIFRILIVGIVSVKAQFSKEERIELTEDLLG